MAVIDGKRYGKKIADWININFFKIKAIRKASVYEMTSISGTDIAVKTNVFFTPSKKYSDSRSNMKFCIPQKSWLNASFNHA